MWDFDHKMLPICLNSFFQYSAQVHSRLTRSVTLNKLSENTSFRTKIHGSNSLRIIVPKVLNRLKENALYTKSNTKFYFFKKYKQDILINY